LAARSVETLTPPAVIAPRALPSSRIAVANPRLSAIGCEEQTLVPRPLYLGKRIPVGGTAHQCGTIRFGRDPNTSALDVNCRAHDLDNLYVVDGSFFVSSGG
jgi:choline dehydrogenase-like flavoprotein